ncbi:MAG TPA: tRNA glutamyl-Q(34) synthetase GluQRS [Tepidisphaeraceae bacterium]|nr:tRNA glutamyl-Q(34) synthetase GluQRS [Tepidisphaeraceae bacterium]
MEVTRLAPSPTGALHLGNARTFLINWLMARQAGWKIILRIEDLDGPRIKPHADQQAMQDLRWLGIDWDEGPIYQSKRTDRYAAAVKELLDQKLAYPCICTRREAALAASAPHAEDGAAVYPGTCRGKYNSIEAARSASGREPAIRLAMPQAPLEFTDQFCGQQRWNNSQQQLGDFVIAKSDGTAAYQLAVVVDDAEMGITQIVRGEDLLDSTPRQMIVYHALNMADRIPHYFHLPLVVGTDGRRLAKRHGDTRLSHYRESGISARRIRGLLARWSGVPCDSDISIEQLLKQFDLARLPHDRMIMSADDEAWLNNG